METFVDSYAEAVARLVRLPLETDGVPASVLSAAERRLGFALPRTLREFYRPAGRMDEVNRYHDRLEMPDELSVEDGFLTIYDENQGVTAWSVCPTTGNDDPPTFIQDARTGQWKPFTTSTSGFLHFMLRWQGVNGAFRYTGIARPSSSALATIVKELPVLLSIGPTVVHEASDHILVVSGDIYGGARTANGFARIERLIGGKWTYTESHDPAS